MLNKNMIKEQPLPLGVIEIYILPSYMVGY